MLLLVSCECGFSTMDAVLLYDGSSPFGSFWPVLLSVGLLNLLGRANFAWITRTGFYFHVLQVLICVSHSRTALEWALPLRTKGVSL